MYYFNLNAKGRQKKYIYNVNTSVREVCIATQLHSLPSFWTYIKNPTWILHTRQLGITTNPSDVRIKEVIGL